MLELYHADAAVCAAKARLVLAEKQIPYQGHLLNLSRGDQFAPAYLALNPNGVVPTLVHDGAVLIESTVICAYLDEAFPAHPLRPADPLGRARVQLWTKREDTIHDTVNSFTNLLFFRPALLARPLADRQARIDAIPDPNRRAKWWDILDHGIEARPISEALVRLARHFADMEQALAAGPWLAGAHFSLADTGLVSFFNRFTLLSLTGLWSERFPLLTDWFARCQARPSFAVAIGDFISPAVVDTYATSSAPGWPAVRSLYHDLLEQMKV